MIRDPYAFLIERKARHGPVFRSRILGRPVAFVSGPRAMAAFLDEENVTREGGHPAHVRALFGGINVNMYDGLRHRALKSILLTGFNRAALTGYVAPLQGLIEEALTRWAEQKTLAWQAELRRLSIEAICLNVLGLPSGGDDVEALRRDYIALAPGFLAVPVAFPGTTFWRATRARDRILSRLRGYIAARRAVPTDDGLSQILAATASDGRRISDDEMALELHHSIAAGYIVFGLLGELVVRLHAQPALRERALEEVRRLAPTGPVALETLFQLRFVEAIVFEAKRTAPIVPLVFGTARRTFELGGYNVPKGWGVFLGLSLSNRDASVFVDPDSFDPDRFGPERQENVRTPHGFVPQGGGPPTGHRCLGLEYSTMMAQLFLVLLLRDYEWDLPEQDLGYHYNLIPAELRSGLRATLTRRA